MSDNLIMDEMNLVNRVKDGSDDLAFNEILVSYTRMIESIVNNYVNDIGDFRLSREDLKQEACIGLYDACRAYKNNMNTKFSTFAYTCVKRKVHSYCRKMSNVYYKENVSLDNFQTNDHSLIYATKCENNDYLYKREVLQHLMNKLNHEDRAIVDMRINNYSYKEISSCLNIKEKRVDNRLMHIKDCLSKSKLVNKEDYC